MFTFDNMQRTYSIDEYRDIGIAFARLLPGWAAKFDKQIKAMPRPKLEDLSYISLLFDKFCEYKNIDGIDSKILTKKEYVRLRYVFIGIIIHLYNPDMLTEFGALRGVKRNLSITLARVLGTHRSWICASYEIILLRLKVYDEFRQDVLNSLEYCIKNLK